VLWLITGALGSGKSAFAHELAASLGREGVLLGCPPFPDGGNAESGPPKSRNERFAWSYSRADASLPAKIDAVNLESNLFRSERRILVLDSLSGWLRGLFETEAHAARSPEEACSETVSALLGFEGKAIVVTEEAAAGLAIGARERQYAYLLAAANRSLLEASACAYRMTAGMATEVKGYRLKRGAAEDEDLYANGR